MPSLPVRTAALLGAAALALVLPRDAFG